MSVRGLVEIDEVDHTLSALMAAGQAGNRVAYETLLLGCLPHIYRILGREGVLEESMGDVVCDVLFTVHRARHTYDPSRSFSIWLGAIAHRRACNSLRSLHRRGRTGLTDEKVTADFHPYSEDHGSEEEKRLLAREMEEAIARLPLDQREAVVALIVRRERLTQASEVAVGSPAAPTPARERTSILILNWLRRGP